MATACSAYILYCIVEPFKSSYNRDLDIIKSYYLIAIAAVFAVLFHSNLNRSVWADFGWAFTQYLETIAILSQFILFNKKVKNNIKIGRINRNLHIPLHRSPSHLPNILLDILGIYLQRTKRIQPIKSFKPPTRVCRNLVYDNSSCTFIHYGRFHVLLD